MNKWIVCLISVLCITGCHPAEKSKKIAFPVHVESVVVEDIPQFVKGVGQLLPSLAVSVKSQVSGILTNILFTDGQLVEEGDLLMTIDSRIYESAVDQARAQLAESQAKLKYALEFAQTYSKLVGNNYVSRLNYEEAIQNVDTYKAAVENSLAAIKKAEVDLSYTQIRAPFKGYVGLRTLDPGNYVEAAADGNLVTVNKVVPLSVRFYVSGDLLHEIRERQEENPLYLEAELPDDPAHLLQGSLWFINNTVDPESGLITLQGTIPNEDERGWPGQFVRVFLKIKTLHNAVLVPKEAIVLGESGSFVFVLDPENMTVNMRMIGKGFVYKKWVVVTWGLSGGEKVITDGQLNLYENASVFIP